jgi:hypothetical protein
MDADAVYPPPGSKVVVMDAMMATVSVIPPCRGSSNNVVSMKAVMEIKTSIPPCRNSSKAVVAIKAVVATKTAIPPHRGNSKDLVTMKATVATTTTIHPPRGDKDDAAENGGHRNIVTVALMSTMDAKVVPFSTMPDDEAHDKYILYLVDSSCVKKIHNTALVAIMTMPGDGDITHKACTIPGR